MEQKQSILDTIKSVGWAFLGVQSAKNRERDFTQGNFVHFAIIGFIGVVLFVALLMLIVSSVLG